MVRKIHFSILLVLIAAFSSNAQEAQWTEVVYSMEVLGFQSIQDVRNNLLKIARQKAVENISGVSVSTTSLSNDSWETQNDDNDFFQSFKVLSSVSSQGLIVEERDAKYSQLPNGHQQINYLGKVAKPEVTNDPTFSLKVELNQKVFRVNESLEMFIESTKDGYLTVIGIYENEKAGVIFPNAYMKDNSLEAYKQRALPNSQEKAKDYQFITEESPGLEKYSEVLLFVVTKEPILFQELESDINYNSTWLDVNRWLMKIPSNKRAIAYTQYQIIQGEEKK